MFGFFKRRKQPPEAPAAPETSHEPHAAADDDPRHFIREIAAIAEKHVAMSKDTFDVVLDYSVESLGLIDEIISNNWDEPPIMLDQMVVMFGAYVGETLRRRYGGSWEYDEEHGYALTGLADKDVRVFPFAKTHKRFTNGEGDSLAFYHEALSKLIDDTKSSG